MLSKAYDWIIHHDDSAAFAVLYIGLAVLLAILLGLFWLAVVVGAHLVLEIIKQHHRDPRPLPILARSLWEMKLDIGLVVCGLVIGVYIDVLFGIAGIGHAGRAGAQAAARAGMWPRVLRGVLLTVDDVALVAKGGVFKKKKAAGAEDLYALEGAEEDGAVAAVEARQDWKLWAGWNAPRWGWGDRLSLGFTVINVLLLLGAPLLTGQSASEVWGQVLADLHPFP